MAMRIGRLSKLTNCPVVTIRFYEKAGLLTPASRTHSNYRLYEEKDVDRLRFILHCRQHGISLKDIQQLLVLKENPELGCSFVHELISSHLRKVEEELKSLVALREELEKLQTTRNCDVEGSCGILNKLEAPDGCGYCEKLGSLGDPGETS